MTTTTIIIQARTGSTRLPGKVMYPLDDQPAIGHVVNRTQRVAAATNVVVATSTEPQDDVIERYARRVGADVIRGSESNVLSRFNKVINQYNPETVVRVTGDCPLISPRFINTSINRILKTKSEYVSGGLERTFPRGLTCEAFTAESFKTVCASSTKSHHQEHVTPYYRENPEEFDLCNLNSEEIFDQPRLQNRTDLRLTLDEPADYHLLKTLYREVEFDNIINISDVIEHIDKNGLADMNKHVNQKEIK